MGGRSIDGDAYINYLEAELAEANNRLVKIADRIVKLVSS